MRQYCGESVGKKIARLMMWRRVRECLGEDRFYAGSHAVLASAYGGDIAVLLGYGVPPGQIVAVDLDTRAATICQRKFPHVRVVSGDLLNIARRHADQLASVCFDSTHALNESFLQKVATVATSLRHETILSVVFVRAHEKDPELFAKVERNKRMLDIAYQTVWKSGAHRSADFSRQMTLLSEVNDRLVARRRRLVQHQSSVYHSRRSVGGGSPMASMVCSVWVGGLGLGLDAFERRAEEAELQALSWAAERDIDTSISVPQKTDVELRTAALALAHGIERSGSGFVPELLLNINKSTLAAWKAHSTRGTYASEAAE